MSSLVGAEEVPPPVPVVPIEKAGETKGMDATVTEMKVSNKKTPGFYIRAANAFLKGLPAQEAKDGKEALEAKEPVDELKVSGLGEAIATAVATATAVVRENTASISKIETMYPDMPNGRGCAQIGITLLRTGASGGGGGDAYPNIVYGAEVPEKLKSDKMEKKMKKVTKEGGKRGVEIEGAADMGGLQFFVTKVDEPMGDVDLLYESMRAMNEKSDPSEEERKGGSGRIGKMIISNDVDSTKLALCAYIPPSKHGQLKADKWMTDVLAELGGGEMSFGDAYTAKAVIKNDPDKNVFILKVKDNALPTAINYLKGKGLFPDKVDDDEDDDIVFGDDDFP